MSNSIGNEGERFVPGTLSPENAYEHQHRYEFATELARGKRVLDLASGEGYGAARLAETAASVHAIELDPTAIANAQEQYSRSNVQFVEGSITALENIPALATLHGSFDVVTCFEAIEHVREQEQLLSGVKAMLASGGIFLVSTPDKEQYTDLPNNHNPFHVRELYRAEFLALLRSRFRFVRLYGQRVFAGSHLWLEEQDPQTPTIPSQVQGEYAVVREPSGAFTSVPLEQRKPLYYLAVCSDQPLPALPRASALVNIVSHPDAAYQQHVTHIERELLFAKNQLRDEQSRFATYQRDAIRGLNSVRAQIPRLIAELDDTRKAVIAQKEVEAELARLKSLRGVQYALRFSGFFGRLKRRLGR